MKLVVCFLCGFGVGALLIAALTGRYTIVCGPALGSGRLASSFVVRLDRWTGRTSASHVADYDNYARGDAPAVRGWYPVDEWQPSPSVAMAAANTSVSPVQIIEEFPANTNYLRFVLGSGWIEFPTNMTGAEIHAVVERLKTNIVQTPAH